MRLATLLIAAILALASCEAAPAAAPLPAPDAVALQPAPAASASASAPVSGSAYASLSGTASAAVPAAAPAPAAARDPAEPQGSTLTNAVTTSSGAVADADSAILAIRPKLRRCYESARGKGPEIVGMVTCGVRITKAGTVGAVGLTRRDSLPEPLVDCILRELKAAVFAPRDAEAVIQVPVRFGRDD